jgi:hypothetical protein
MLYDLRSYTFAPGDALKYLVLFQEEGLPLVTRHLPMLGYWLTEGGELNVIHHLWAYRDLADRADRRASLAGDREWMEVFTPKAIFPLIKAQRSAFLVAERESEAFRTAVAAADRVHPAVASGTAPLGSAYLTLSFDDAPMGEGGEAFLAEWRVSLGRAVGTYASLSRVPGVDDLTVAPGGASARDLMRPAVFSPL